MLWPFGLSDIASCWEERRAYKQVCKHLSWADKDYPVCTIYNKSVVIDRTVWVYWRQGFENAPDIVKKCVTSISEHTRGWNLILLTENNLHEYVILPDFIEDKHNKGLISEAHFSDMVRTQLLIQYGGIWMDATCFMNGELPTLLDNVPFFMFSTANWWPALKSPSKCSNWFIKAEKGNQLLVKTRNFMFEHWRNRNKVIHYYVFHFALSALADSNKFCRQIWESMPFISNLQPHLFMFSFCKPYSKAQYDMVLNQCFVHKCTYKYDRKLLGETTENFLQHFLNS